jgi:nucleotide-binding universal stress UspA family protein
MPVVVGANGTAAGLAAVRLAARESVARGQPLRVVHAFSWPNYDATAQAVPFDLLRRAAAEVLARAVGAAARSAPAAQVSGHLIDGAPAAVLLQQSRAAGLLVLGNHDPGATVRLPTESVLVQAVARSRCPVLVALGIGTAQGPVVVGVDGSPAARLALRYAVAEATRRRADLHVVHVRDTEDPTADPDGEADARILLENALAEVGLTSPDRAHAEPETDPVLLRPPDPEPAAPAPTDPAPADLTPAMPTAVSATVLSGDPAAVLVRATTRARLLVVGPNGTEGRFGALLGAVAQTVLRRSGCPTVFVHGNPHDLGL